MASETKEPGALAPREHLEVEATAQALHRALPCCADVGISPGGAVPLATALQPDVAVTGDGPIEWRADERDWQELRLSRYLRVWMLAALALGLKPGSTNQLDGLGRQQELEQFEGLKRVLRRNLTELNDPHRLRYLTGSENDGRQANPKKKVTERMVDIVEFVRFTAIRNIDVPPEMIEIAREIEAGPRQSLALERSKRAGARSSDSLAGTESDVPSACATIGLMLMYLRELALHKRAPGPGLLQGSSNRINTSALARSLSEFVDKRTDLKSLQATAGHSMSPKSLQAALGKGRKFFEDHIAETGSDDEPSVK